MIFVFFPMPSLRPNHDGKRPRPFLFPAARPGNAPSFAEIHHILSYRQLLAWTFGRGSVVRSYFVATFLLDR